MKLTRHKSALLSNCFHVLFPSSLFRPLPPLDRFAMVSTVNRMSFNVKTRSPWWGLLATALLGSTVIWEIKTFSCLPEFRGHRDAFWIRNLQRAWACHHAK
jgi:hypothetical protein